jgi:hypothetical protein
LQNDEQFCFAKGSISAEHPLKLLAAPWSMTAALLLMSCSWLSNTIPAPTPARSKAIIIIPAKIFLSSLNFTLFAGMLGCGVAGGGDEGDGPVTGPTSEGI